MACSNRMGAIGIAWSAVWVLPLLAMKAQIPPPTMTMPQNQSARALALRLAAVASRMVRTAFRFSSSVSSERSLVRKLLCFLPLLCLQILSGRSRPDSCGRPVGLSATSQ